MVTERTTRTQELIKKDAAHYVHQIGKIGQAPQVIWERGEGAKVWDTDGKQYIDMSSGGVHCNTLGFARKEIREAVYEQMGKLGTMFAGGTMSNVQVAEYAAELTEILPGDINHVYLDNAAKDANEVAIQMTRLYFYAQGKADKYKILSLAHSYHGGTFLTRSLSGVYYSAAIYGAASYPGIIHIPNYYCYQCPFGLKYPSCNITCARFVEQVIEQEGGNTIAAFFAEPVQGAAGVVWPPDEYWPIVRRILSEHDVLLINDCCQTGFCRTGRFWGVDNWNIVPDMMTMGKGINGSDIPLGALGISDKVYKVIQGSYFPAASTTAGNAVVAASGRAALKIYKEEKLAERSARLGEHLHERLVKEFLPLPCVDDVMGKGCYQSFEIALNKTTGSKFDLEATIKVRENLFSQFLEKGVFCGRWDGFPRRQCICPPLIIGEDELDKALDVMLSIMKEVKPV